MDTTPSMSLPRTTGLTGRKHQMQSTIAKKLTSQRESREEEMPSASQPSKEAEVDLLQLISKSKDLGPIQSVRTER